MTTATEPPELPVASSNEPMSWEAVQLVARHAQHLQRGLETFSRHWLEAPQANAPPLVYSWVASRVHSQANINTPPPQLPVCVLALWNGWLEHDASRFESAQSLFQQAWATLQAESPDHWRYELADAALGLGRTHTRSGHWNTARAWLLCALAIARRVGDESLCVRGYGALGELLLRAGHNSAGFTCLNMAYHLLSAGSGQRARQLNYIGTALGRLHERLRAESVLMTSFSMAADQGDIASQLHALARLHFLALTSASSTELAVALPNLADASIDQAPAVARGYWCLARARARSQNGEAAQVSESALALLDQAMQDFQTANRPMEWCWAALWHQHFTGNAQPWHSARAAMTQQMSMPVVEAPQALGMLDHSFACLPIAQSNGFDRLLSLPDKLERLKALDQLFFV